MAIKASGISCIIARSFARIFFRNSINIGLPILECPEAADALLNGDNAEVDLEKGTIKNVHTGAIYQAEPFPPFLREIIDAGGLINFIKRNK
jgi:3-isopropylmalate/(R)-2-methylmalate dehydratase small subunit